MKEKKIVLFLLVLILLIEKGYSQNTLRIIKIVEQDSSIIKTQFNNKLYYTISYSRFMISSYKTNMYDNLITTLPYYIALSKKDSLNIININKEKTDLFVSNILLKDSLSNKDKTILNKENDIVLLKEEKKSIKSRSNLKSVIIVGLVIEFVRSFF